MGMFHSKCPQCWDTEPCNCPAQKERDDAVRASIEHDRQREAKRTNDLLEEQNRLIREQNELLRRQK